METAILTPIVTVIPPTITSENRLNKRLNVAAYARVSTDSEEQESSFEVQQSYYENKINSEPNWKLYKIFADAGITATQAKKRPDFMEMIKFCRKGKIDLILTKSISRFARNTLDSLAYVRELRALGVGIIFEKEGINTLENTSQNEMMFTILSCFSQAESESISQNVTWGIRQHFCDGKTRINYTNFLGYRKSADGKPEIVDNEAEIVRLIFKLYIDGLSQKQIADELIGRDIPNKNGEINWDQSRIRRILTNEKYSGEVLLQKTFTPDCLSHKSKKNNGEVPMYLVKNHHMPIIDKEIFDRVQEEIARRNSVTTAIGGARKEKNSRYSAKYALTDIVICSECGTAYRRTTWTQKGEKVIVWRCINRLDNGKKYCKKSPTIHESELHEKIIEAINELFDVKNEVAEIFESNIKETVLKDSDNSIENAENRITELQNETKLLVEKCAAEDDFDKCQDEFKRLSSEISKLRSQIEIEKSKSKSAKNNRINGNEIFKFLNSDNAKISEFDEVLCRQIIDKIKVNNGSIEIIFKGGAAITKTL